MTLLNKMEGGDAYGKVPKRIFPALFPPLKIIGAKGVMIGFVKGKTRMPGPGKMPYHISSPFTGEDLR